MSNPGTYQYLIFERKGPVGVVTLNRPEVLNACNPDMHREVQAVMDEAEDDSNIHSIVINGAGRAFCSGSDLRDVSKFQGAAARSYLKLDFTTKNRVAACSKPVIASLHGHVAGGGFELALACDIRFVSDDVIFSFPEITLGTLPGSGGLQRLPSIVGLGIAKEWVFTGRRIDAQEAFRTGLANAVLAKSDVLQHAIEFARELSSKSALALAFCKAALDPEPPAVDGIVGTFHTLASQVCHDDPAYQKRASSHDRDENKD